MATFHRNVVVHRDPTDHFRAERLVLRSDGAIAFRLDDTDVDRWQGSDAVRVLRPSQYESITIEGGELESVFEE